jgi:hypothetical protein
VCICACECVMCVFVCEGASLRAVGCGLAGCCRRRPSTRCRLGGLAPRGLAAAARGCLQPARCASRLCRRQRVARLSRAVRGRRALARRATLRAARSVPRASLRAVGCGLAGCGSRRPGARCRLGGLAPRGLAAATRGCLQPARHAKMLRRRQCVAWLSLAVHRRFSQTLLRCTGPWCLRAASQCSTLRGGLGGGSHAAAGLRVGVGMQSQSSRHNAMPPGPPCWTRACRSPSLTPRALCAPTCPWRT